MGSHQHPLKEVEPLSEAQAVITLLKAIIGAGLLALPYACSKVHLAFALPAMLLIAVLTALGVWRFVQCKYYICCKGDISHIQDYGFGPIGGVVGFAFGRCGLVLTGAAILLKQFGTGVCYIDIIIHSLEKRFCSFLSIFSLRLLLGLVLCGLSLVRRLRELSWLSAAALGIYFLTLLILMKYCYQALQDDSAESVIFLPVGWDGMNVFFGTTVFAFGSIGVAPYVYDAMQSPDTQAFRRVLIVSYGICFVLYSALGGFGYWCYGGTVKRVLYDNFPVGSLDVNLIEPAICLILTLSYVLQMYPVLGIVEGWLESMLPSRSFTILPDGEPNEDIRKIQTSSFSWRELLMMVVSRWIVVGISVLGATYVPDITKVMEYISCFSYGTLALVLPACIHIHLCRSEMSVISWCGDILLLATGLCALGHGVQNLLGG